MVRKAVPTPLESVLAGASAGGVESLVTYPTEYIKTRKQLLHSKASPLQLLIDAVKTSGIKSLYTGAGAFCVSNASKSGVRFLAFDTVISRLPNDARTGNPTKTASMIAGVLAGVAESVTVVTPGENIKTRMIDHRGQSRSTTCVIRSIVSSNGLRGFFRGIVPVTMKQGSNALVRFTSYTILKDTLEPGFSAAGHSKLVAPVAGAAAGIVTVYATMPFDTLKTKMQAVDASPGRGTWQSLVATVGESGVRGLWQGTTPRLARLSVSGALSFTIYEMILEVLQKSRLERGRDQANSLDVSAT